MLGIVMDAETQSEEADHRCWGDIVVKAETRIDEHQTPVGVDKQTGCTQVPAWQPRRHRRAIENADRHERLSAEYLATKSFDPSRTKRGSMLAMNVSRVESLTETSWPVLPNCAVQPHAEGSEGRRVKRGSLGGDPVLPPIAAVPDVATLQDAPTARAFYRLIRTI